LIKVQLNVYKEIGTVVIHVTLRQIGWPVMTSNPTVTMILTVMKCIRNKETNRDISQTLQLQAFVLDSI
jgi:hypothetical protein